MSRVGFVVEEVEGGVGWKVGVEHGFEAFLGGFVLAPVEDGDDGFVFLAHGLV